MQQKGGKKYNVISCDNPLGELAKRNYKGKKRINYLLLLYEELKKKGQIQPLDESVPLSPQKGRNFFNGR